MYEEKFEPYYIQRLEKPHDHFNLNDCALGFNKQGLDLIGQVMSFDYMGSSEFEWGALPKAFREYIEKLKEGEIEFKTINLEILRPSLWGTARDFESKIPQTKFTEIYVIAPKAIMDMTISFIESLTIEEPRLKELSKFRESIFAEDILKHDDYASGDRTVGWFDIENTFFFFRDRQMFEAMKIASGLQNTKPENKATAAPIPPQPA